MARVSSNLQRIFYPSFNGGLNLSVPPESLQKNELKEAVNVSFSPVTGAMTVRGGLFLIRDIVTASPVKSVEQLPGLQGFIAARENREAKIVTRYSSEYAGVLTGDGAISVCEWDGDYLVASGGKLQRLPRRSLTLETIEGSPEKCRAVFVREGRAGVVNGDSEIRFSAVGDCGSWTNNPDDDSTAQYVEIGYKDGMSIDAVIPLSRDLIIFKSPDREPDKGTIFRLTGEFPDWAVIEAAHNTGTFSQRSIQAVGNDVYFATVAGIASLSAVTSYGEIQASWPDRKVSAVLSRILSKDAEMWNIPAKSQLWVKPQRLSREVWVLDCAAGIWTTYEFSGEVIYAGSSDDDTYVITGGKVCSLIDSKVKDDIGGAAVCGRLRLGTLITGNQALIRRGMVSFRVAPDCKAELRLGEFRMNFSHAVTEKCAFDDTSCAYDDESEIIPSEKVITARRECIVRGWTVTPDIEMTGGGCALSTMGLEIAEV